MAAYLLATEYTTDDPRMGKILLFRDKNLSTTRKKHSKTDEESSAQNRPGALALSKKPEQQEQTNVLHGQGICYRAKVDYLL